MKSVKSEIEESGELKFCNSIKQGYYVTGDESALRKIIQEKINELKTPEGKAVLKIYMQNSLFSLTENEIDFYKLCICIIKQYELDIKNEYILSDMQTEGFMIQVSWIRSLKGYTIKLSDDEKNALTGTLSYRSVENSVEKMARCGIEMVQEEVYYLASMLLGIETTGFKTHREEERFIEKIADQFISNFERITCLVFYNRSKLRHELFHHLRALFYRMKYGTPSDNPLTRDIKQMYSFVFEATRRAIAEVGNDFMRDIPDTEIAYLCIYMVSNLDEKKVHQSAKYDGSILIVGPKNMAIATLIKEQIQNLLGDSFEYDVISLSRLKTRMLSEYVMVSIGVSPNTKFIDSVEKLPNGAIITNTAMETSVKDVYAAGDCGTVYHKILKKPAFIALGTYANKQGRLAGDSMIGKEVCFDRALGTSMLRCLGMEFAKTGISEKEAKREGLDVKIKTVTTRSHARYYPDPVELTIKFVYDAKDHTLLGAQIMGAKEAAWRIDVCACAIDQGMTTEELGYLDLGYAPMFAGVWDAIGIAANASK